jgi:hypothetical protein
VGIRRGWRPPFGEATIALAAVAGAGLGFLYGLLAPPPQGPVPGSLLAPMCGALVPLCVVAFLSGSRAYGWTFAWLLAALSAYVQEAPPSGVASMAALVAATLLAAGLAQWGSVRRGGGGAGGAGRRRAGRLAGTVGEGRGLLASQGFWSGSSAGPSTAS